ncbi:MAG TPA: selenocysteine-specific translation elongation factor [Anaerohalosphaeraceae bacterium]|nr:selenocysteine-specific translation elongation factor [Anaerohalosphaeraceae bacterium]
MSQINITLGTAGHVDHGKTSLVKCLTGCETDRLKEEKERGMSIELGFAPCTLGDLEVGIVDVPGHEHFIKTMVAGATGIDGVIFLVAADDGIMPQTREHLDILTLLGIGHGVVALTKVDMVSPERVDKVSGEIRVFLRGTFLQDSPICPVSSVTGQGFDAFYGCLMDMVKSIRPKPADGIFRQPVERAFSVKGFGTVISGIPCAGQARVGDEVTLLPEGSKSRIKAIQVYGKTAEVVQNGQCAAISVPQVDHQIVQRGQVLTAGDYFEPQRWFLASLRILPLDTVHIRNGMEIKFHTGTAETPATLYLLESDEAAAGAEILVQIRTEHLLVTGPRDRFIIRSLSPVRTIGGGYIVRGGHHKLKRTDASVVEDARRCAAAVLNEQDFVAYASRSIPAGAARLRDIAYQCKMPPAAVQQVLDGLRQTGLILQLADGLFAHSDTVSQFEQLLCGCIGQYHAAHPETPGMEPSALLEQSGLDKAIFDAMVSRLLEQSKIVTRKDRLALAGFVEQFKSPEARLMGQVELLFGQNLFSPPSAEELAAFLKTHVSQIEKTIKLLCDQKRLCRVELGMYFHADAIEQAKQRIANHVKTEGQGRLESVDFKYLIDTTRKFAIPLLDYMDKIGFTRRVGNTRYLKA